MSNKTWIVQAMSTPEMAEKICCESIFDAARGWAERLFRQGVIVPSGTSVLVRCADDLVVKRPGPGSTANRSFGTGHNMGLRHTGMSATIYKVKIEMVNMPSFHASLEGVVYEGDSKEDPRGE